MVPPGAGLAPGMQQAQSPQASAFPTTFQPPPNMPNINFSAPVIRLGVGTGGPNKPDTPTGGMRKDSNMEPLGNRRGAGLGFDSRGIESQRHQMRENMMSLAPPTREEIARTIFVGNITEGCGGDEGMQRILGVAGGLRRWIRCVDADNKTCTFGFAEYEDADSLSTACEIFQDIEVPSKRPAVNGTAVKKEEGEDEEKPDMTKLLVCGIRIMILNIPDVLLGCC